MQNSSSVANLMDIIDKSFDNGENHKCSKIRLAWSDDAGLFDLVVFHEIVIYVKLLGRNNNRQNLPIQSLVWSSIIVPILFNTSVKQLTATVCRKCFFRYGHKISGVLSITPRRLAWLILWHFKYWAIPILDPMYV